MDEQTFPSTPMEWRRVKVGRPAGGQMAARSSTYGWRKLRRTDRTKKIRLTVSWRGGAECRWLVEARGQHAVVSGFTCLEDLMSAIHNDYR